MPDPKKRISGIKNSNPLKVPFKMPEQRIGDKMQQEDVDQANAENDAKVDEIGYRYANNLVPIPIPKEQQADLMRRGKVR